MGTLADHCGRLLSSKAQPAAGHSPVRMRETTASSEQQLMPFPLRAGLEGSMPLPPACPCPPTVPPKQSFGAVPLKPVIAPQAWGLYVDT